MNEELIAIHAIVSGMVQGVGFRSWAADTARRHSITGWVRNNPDGTVELEAEGTTISLQSFFDSLKQGNSISRVDRIEENRVQPAGYARFSIDY
jgi:acylphosphatase